MKILFVDIDGVLNVNGFEKHFVNNFNRIIDETEAKIVISSSWRSDGLEQLKTKFNEVGLKGEIIDTTPTLFYSRTVLFWNGKEKNSVENNETIERGVEVKWWLSNEGFHRSYYRDNNSYYKKQNCEIENYCIIDDDCDFLIEQMDHFVCCGKQWEEPDHSSGYGLTDKATNKVIEILNRKLNIKII